MPSSLRSHGPSHASSAYRRATLRHALSALATVVAVMSQACAGSGDSGGSDPDANGASGAAGSSQTAGAAGASNAGTGGNATAGASGAGAGGVAACFPKTAGAVAEQGRTDPCTKADVGQFEVSCQSGLQRACLPNYDAWIPIVCGAPPVDACACDDSKCLPGEAAKLVSGMFCACLNLCAKQMSGATCGANGERKCIPVDDAKGKQVFICGGN